jgi:hypothetical protein
MNRDAAPALRRAVRERSDELLRRALAASIPFQISKTLDEEDRGDDGGSEIIEQDRLIEIETFQGGFVAHQGWALHHMRRNNLSAIRIH